MTGTRRRSGRFALASLVTTTMLAVAAVPSALAGSAAAPEILDAAGDVSPAAFATNETVDNETLSEMYQNVTAYDVVQAWVGLESASDFWIFIHVRDLPDGWSALGAPPEESPFGANASHAGTSLVANFSISGQTYQAIAKLAMPKAGALFDNYTIWRGDEWAPVAGVYNTTQDWVAMILPKAAFAGLGDGVRLTQFWVQGRFADFAMDYAPDARGTVTGLLTQDPFLIAEKVAAGELVEPMYGLEYEFGQYYKPPSTSPAPGNWPTAPAVRLSSTGASERSVARGESVSYEIRVANQATASDTAYFALNSAGSGWSHQLSETQVELGPGQGRLLYLTVSAAPDARGAMESIVSVSTSLGGTDALSLRSSVLESAPGGPGSGGSSPGSAPATTQPEGGAPGFGVLLVAVAALVALGAFGLRRRR